jgi:hypothetical protein
MILWAPETAGRFLNADPERAAQWELCGMARPVAGKDARVVSFSQAAPGFQLVLTTSRDGGGH